MVHFTMRRALGLMKYGISATVIQIEAYQRDGKEWKDARKTVFGCDKQHSLALKFKKSIAQVKDEDNLAEIQFPSQWQEWV